MSAPALIPEGVRLVVFPIVHESHGRVTRQTWGAALEPVEAPAVGEPESVFCGHPHGHKTITVAQVCAGRLWRRTFPGVPVPAVSSGGDR